MFPLLAKLSVTVLFFEDNQHARLFAGLFLHHDTNLEF